MFALPPELSLQFQDSRGATCWAGFGEDALHVFAQLLLPVAVVLQLQMPPPVRLDAMERPHGLPIQACRKRSFLDCDGFGDGRQCLAWVFPARGWDL